LNGQNKYHQECIASCQNSSSEKCCQFDNCNEVILPSVVSTCLVGGNLKLSDVVTINKPVSIQSCRSPRNQYCMSQKGTSSLAAIDMNSCSDTCVPVNTPELVVKCCQRDNCNTPITQNLLTCIKQSSIDDFTPAPVTCNFNHFLIQHFCIFIYDSHLQSPNGRTFLSHLSFFVASTVQDRANER